MGFRRFLIFVVFALVAANLLILVLWKTTPDISILRTVYPKIVYHGPKQPFTVQFSSSPPISWVSLNNISRQAIGAILVSEDWAFYQHKGFDPNQIREAIMDDLEAGRLRRGASTITQQVAKNVFLSGEKSLWRKLRELAIAIEMERKIRKAKILEIYLNIAEWGTGIYGIGAAAQHYFQKPPSELSPKEGAFLAMLLPSPKRYSQSFRDQELTKFARRRVNDILNKMVQAQYLTQEERDREVGLVLPFEAPPTPTLTEGEQF